MHTTYVYLHFRTDCSDAAIAYMYYDGSTATARCRFVDFVTFRCHSYCKFTDGYFLNIAFFQIES